MAEGGTAVDQDETETMSSFHDAPPSIADVLVMTVEELRAELRVHGVAFTGGTKPELQVLLMQELGHVRNPHPDQQDSHSELAPDTEELPLEEAPQLDPVRMVPSTHLSGRTRTTPFPHRAD